MLTKLNVSMLHSEGISGSALKVLEGQVHAAPDLSKGEEFDIVVGDYDADAGVILLQKANKSILRIEGLLRPHDLGIGKQGIPGIPGKDGKDGKPGRNGKDGRNGCQGVKGDRGRRGVMGPEGPEGKEGPQGPQGPQGPEGPQGKPGKDGEEPVYVVGSGGSYEYTIKYGRITQWGTYVAGSVDQAIEIPFPVAFNRECTSVEITFLNGGCQQAQIYELSWSTESFLLEVPKNTPVPLDTPWAFSWRASGD